MLRPVITELTKLSNPSKAKILSGFFKTGKGKYNSYVTITIMLVMW